MKAAIVAATANVAMTMEIVDLATAIVEPVELASVVTMESKMETSRMSTVVATPALHVQKSGYAEPIPIVATIDA